MKSGYLSVGQWLELQGNSFLHLDLLPWELAAVCANTLKPLKLDPAGQAPGPSQLSLVDFAPFLPRAEHHCRVASGG